MKEKIKYNRSDSNLDLDLFFKNSLDLVYVHDLSGRFLDANDLTLETLGYQRHEVNKIKFRNLIDENSLNLAFLILKELMETGKQSKRSEYKLVNREGKDIYLNTYGIPLKKEGKLFAVLGVARDVTEQRLAEDLLKKSEEKYRLIIETANDLITIFNSNFDAEYVNVETHKRITGYTKDELIGQNMLKYIHPDDIAIVTEKFKEVFDKSQAICRTRYLNKDGSVIWLEAKGKLLKDIDGEEKVLVLSRNITDLMKNEAAQKILFDRILKSSQFKTDFMATMSHELRTPLNAIAGFTELLLDQSYGELNENQFEYLEDISSSSIHLMSIVNGILNISKIEAGELELNLTALKLNVLIEQINSAFKPLYSKKGLAFFIEIDETIDEIIADRVRLTQILYNLVGNAVKFTETGSITLSVERSEEFILFTIADSGIGIAKEDYELIFEEFKQVQNYLESPGSGLGLPLVRRLVNLHGGTITFESSLGEGSSFAFTIPG